MTRSAESRQLNAQCLQSVAVQTVRGKKTDAPHLRAPTRPSIMSEGDTQSAPARACTPQSPTVLGSL